MKLSSCSPAILAIASLAIGLSSTHAQSLYWDAIPGNVSPAGAWDGITANWNSAADGTGVTSATTSLSNSVTFSAGAAATGPYTVTVTGSQAANGIVVEEGTVTLAGASTPELTVGSGGISVTGSAILNNVSVASLTSIRLAASQTWATTSSGSAPFDTNAANAISPVDNIGVVSLTVDGTTAGRIRGSISDGTGNTLSVIKNGTGTWRFDGGNSFTGGFTINDGRVGLGANNALGAGNVTINGGLLVPETTDRTIANPVTVGGNFSVNSTSAGSRNLRFSGAVDLGGANRTITVNDSAQTSDLVFVSTSMVSNGALTKEGAGLLLVQGMNTYAGGTAVNAGTVSTGSSTGNFGTGNVTLANVAGVNLILGNPVSIDDSASVLFNSVNIITMSFVGIETVANLTDGTKFASEMGEGAYTAEQLNAFFGGSTFVDSGTVGDAFFYVVPEPSTVALMAGGLGMLLLFGRRRSDCRKDH